MATPLTPPVPPTRGHRARSDLLLAGAALFAERGLEGATTREIAARAGQNIAAIAYYFGGKEGLYLDVARGIAGQLEAALGPALGEVELFLRQSRRDRRRAVELVRQLTETAVAGLLLRPDLAALTGFVLREQLHPTRASELLYEGGLERVHRALTGLVAAALGLEPDGDEAAVRAHALLGQVLGFRVAGAALLRRAGWTAIGPAEAALIARVVGENVRAVLSSR